MMNRDGDEDNQIKFKTSMLRSSLSHYSNVYIVVKEIITVANTAAQGTATNNADKKVIFKHCAPFINCRSRINNMQLDDAHDLDVVVPMCNLIEQ